MNLYFSYNALHINIDTYFQSVIFELSGLISFTENEGKNFVFDHRRSERISGDVISNCHQCGKPCDTHTNCINESCHLLFIQCEDCREKMNSCCSKECIDTIELSYDKQKYLRRGKRNSHKIFKKGRSNKLKFKIN